MKIAELSTLARPVPPRGEGSIEYLVYLITEGLVQRGHEVTLFATSDSQTSAFLRSPVQKSYSASSEMWDWQLYEAFQVQQAFRRWTDFDVFHCHAYYHALLYCDFVPVPSIHSVHIEPGPDYLFLAQRTRNRHFLFCSQHQASGFQIVRDKTVIPHGIDTRSYHSCPREERGGYLAFLGRFIPEKGPEEAIRLARAAGMPLRIAAPENQFFHERIKPLLGREVEYAGELIGTEKREFLAKANGLLYPIQRPEPFGLVLLEAMASGTPSFAYGIGAVPEILEHEKTGWLASDEASMLEGLGRIDEFNHEEIRIVACRQFSVARMVDQVEDLMLRLVGERC
jgi:glycosyltransferase involved in cell wall biosynthesis